MQEWRFLYISITKIDTSAVNYRVLFHSLDELLKIIISSQKIISCKLRYLSEIQRAEIVISLAQGFSRKANAWEKQLSFFLVT